MGLLNFLGRANTTVLMRLPAGSFTIDRTGRVLVSTLPRSFPQALVEQIGALVLQTFRSAQAARVPLVEVMAEFAALRLTAREMRGGAIVFLTPRGLGAK